MPRSIKVGLVFRPGRRPLSRFLILAHLSGCWRQDDGFLFIVFISFFYFYFFLLSCYEPHSPSAFVADTPLDRRTFPWIILCFFPPTSRDASCLIEGLV